MYKEERHLERCLRLPAADKEKSGVVVLFSYQQFKPSRPSSKRVFKDYLLSSEAFEPPLT